MAVPNCQTAGSDALLSLVDAIDKHGFTNTRHDVELEFEMVAQELNPFRRMHGSIGRSLILNKHMVSLEHWQSKAVNRKVVLTWKSVRHSIISASVAAS